MKHRYLVIPVALTLSATALAHGNHAEVPTDSLLHLLAHHWPLLLLAGALAASWPLLKRNKS
jgi:hypothetical protein